MKAKKLVAVGMTVLMLGGLFVGCGNSADTSTGANSGKNVKITIFQSKIEANEGYKKLIAAYEKDHPNVEINLEAVTGNDFGASMKAKMQSDPPTSFTFVQTLIKCIISSFYMCFVIDYPHNPIRS